MILQRTIIAAAVLSFAAAAAAQQKEIKVGVFSITRPAT